MRGFIIGALDRLLIVAVTLVLAAIAFKVYVPAPPVLTNQTPIVVRYISASGAEVMRPETMPLWKYVEVSDQANANTLAAFKTAFEQDLHAHDATFHLTHELIDGRRW